MPTLPSKKAGDSIFRTELPDTSMLENKLGFLGETGGANTYKSESPIVDWNENFKLKSINKLSNNQIPGIPGRMITKRNEQ